MCSFANTPFTAANKLNENDASVSELKSNIFAKRFDKGHNDVLIKKL